MPLQIRRGTNAERTAMTQPLAAGELLYVTDTQRIYVGNGSTLGGIAVTGYTDADARDSAASIFTSGSHNGINFSYNTATDVMTATVDLSNYSGTINAASFKGSLVSDDSVLLIDAVDGKINLNETINSHVVPDQNNAYDLGTSSNGFRNLFLSGTNIRLGSATITASGSAINLPAGSTIGGLPIGMPGGDLNVNIVSNDSTVIVNTTTEVVTAQGGVITPTLTTNFIDGDTSSEVTVRTSLRVLSDLNVENEIFGRVLGSSFSQTSGRALVNTANNELSTGRLRFERNIITTVDSEEIVVQTPRLRLDFESAATTGGEIVTGLDASQFLEFYMEPNVGDHVAGSIGGMMSWSPVDSSGREYGQVFVGAQLDPAVPFTSTYGAQKFFIVNSPDTEPSDPLVPSEFRYLTFDSKGWLAVNQENASATLDINGFAKLAILTAAPASPANGMVAIADGTSWNPLANGKQSMVVYLGGGWRQIATAP